MKIELNLLPEEQKKQLHQQRFFRSALQQEIYIASIIFIFFFGLFGIHTILSSEKDLLKLQVAEQNKTFQDDGLEEAHQLFHTVGDKGDMLYTLSKNHIVWTPLLKEISNIVTKDIRIDEIHLHQGKLVIDGVARTREHAVTFKKQMEGITIKDVSCFYDVIIPAENLVAATNTTFKLNATVAEGCVRGVRSGDDVRDEQAQQDTQQSDTPGAQEDTSIENTSAQQPDANPAAAHQQQKDLNI